jgi:restriction system protein
MAIPKQQELYEPIFRLLSDSIGRSLTEIETEMCLYFNLNEAEKQTLKSSGTQRLMMNRCGWATWRLSQPNLVAKVGRGIYKMTDAGLVRSKSALPLSRFELFPDIEKNTVSTNQQIPENTDLPNPEEGMEESNRILRLKLADDLLIEVKQHSPKFFEKLVVQLILALGYGGSTQEAGRAVGQTGDGGIDGIINEDRLGLDAIYLQAKRYTSASVPVRDVRDFVGALVSKKATKGVFLTTSKFTTDAIDFIKDVPQRVVLIDGARLTSLMIEYNLGVSVVETYQLKKIDTDFFDEE